MKDYVSMIANGEIKEWQIEEKVPLITRLIHGDKIKEAVARYNRRDREYRTAVTFITGGTEVERVIESQKDRVGLLSARGLPLQDYYECYRCDKLPSEYSGQSIIIFHEPSTNMTGEYFRRLVCPSLNYPVVDGRRLRSCSKIIIASSYSLDEFMDELHGLDERTKAEIACNVLELMLIERKRK